VRVLCISGNRGGDSRALTPPGLPLRNAAQRPKLREQIAYLLAGCAPAALLVGGLVAAFLGQTWGLAAAGAGALGGIGLWRIAARDPQPPASDFSEDRMFLRLVDQIPVAIWIEDWRSARDLMERADAQGGARAASWLDENRELRRKTSSMMRVLHSNPAAMELYKAPSRASLASPDFENFVTRENG
jgi:hypothetical protein